MFEKALYVLITLVCLFAIGVVVVGTIDDLNQDAPAEPARKTLHDLTPDERAFYHYASHALYVKLHENIHWLGDNATQEQINATWDEYHKHSDNLNELIFGQ